MTEPQKVPKVDQTIMNNYLEESQNYAKQYETQKQQIVYRSRDHLIKNELEEIEEAELSEYESSTIDDRITNIANPTEKSVYTSQNFELVPKEHLAKFSPDNIPILYIDIKISLDKVSRLVLYKNQTPYEAAMLFIEKHGIADKLRPYLINKVQDHYDKIIMSREHHAPRMAKAV